MYKQSIDEYNKVRRNELNLRRDKTNSAVKKFFSDFRIAVNTLFAYIKEWLKKPGVLPTYCFEYAPDC